MVMLIPSLSSRLRQIEMSGHFHTPATLPGGKEPLLLIEMEALQAHSWSGFFREATHLALTGIQTMIPWVSTLLPCHCSVLSQLVFRTASENSQLPIILTKG
jgi:hypothetical protein